MFPWWDPCITPAMAWPTQAPHPRPSRYPLHGLLHMTKNPSTGYTTQAVMVECGSNLGYLTFTPWIQWTYFAMVTSPKHYIVKGKSLKCLLMRLMCFSEIFRYQLNSEWIDVIVHLAENIVLGYIKIIKLNLMSLFLWSVLTWPRSTQIYTCRLAIFLFFFWIVTQSDMIMFWINKVEQKYLLKTYQVPDEIKSEINKGRK